MADDANTVTATKIKAGDVVRVRRPIRKGVFRAAPPFDGRWLTVLDTRKWGGVVTLTFDYKDSKGDNVSQRVGYASKWEKQGPSLSKPPCDDLSACVASCLGSEDSSLEAAKISTKEPSVMTASEINKELDRLDKQSSKTCSLMIEAGRGHEKPSEIVTKNDPLAQECKLVWDRQRALRVEISLRYGPNAPSRLPRGFGPIRRFGGELEGTEAQDKIVKVICEAIRAKGYSCEITHEARDAREGTRIRASMGPSDWEDIGVSPDGYAIRVSSGGGWGPDGAKFTKAVASIVKKAKTGKLGDDSVEPKANLHRSTTLDKTDPQCSSFGTITRGKKQRLVCVLGDSRSSGKARVRVWNKSKKKWQPPQAVPSSAVRSGADPKKFGVK